MRDRIFAPSAKPQYPSTQIVGLVSPCRSFFVCLTMTFSNSRKISLIRTHANGFTHLIFKVPSFNRPIFGQSDDRKYSPSIESVLVFRPLLPEVMDHYPVVVKNRSRSRNQEKMSDIQNFGIRNEDKPLQNDRENVRHWTALRTVNWKSWLEVGY